MDGGPEDSTPVPGIINEVAAVEGAEKDVRLNGGESIREGFPEGSKVHASLEAQVFRRIRFRSFSFFIRRTLVFALLRLEGEDREKEGEGGGGNKGPIMFFITANVFSSAGPHEKRRDGGGGSRKEEEVEEEGVEPLEETADIGSPREAQRRGSMIGEGPKHTNRFMAEPTDEEEGKCVTPVETKCVEVEEEEKDDEEDPFAALFFLFFSRLARFLFFFGLSFPFFFFFRPERAVLSASFSEEDEEVSE